MTPEEPPIMDRLTTDVKGSPSTRLSRRLRGEEPAVDAGLLETDDLGNQKLLKELKSLKKKGGKGGRPLDDVEDWDYFPSTSLESFSHEEIQVHNSNVFQGLGDITDPTPEDLDDTRDSGQCTYQMLHMKNLERVINDNFHCPCSLHKHTDEFLQYCATLNNQMTCEQMMNLRKTWQPKKSKKSESTKINVLNMGLEPIVSVTCTNCNSVYKLPNEYSQYKGFSYTGKKTIRENCSWFNTNLKFVLGTLASGIGASEAATLLSFIGLPNLQSFSRRQFHRIELLVGKCLRNIADISTKEALELEIKMTQDFKQEENRDWKTDDNPTGLTLSFDMGWSKRSSGNRYDSLSGHAFLLGGHSKKIVSAQVTSRQCSTCSSAASKGVEPREHECPKNYHGSSKAMEADAALSLFLKLDREYNSKLFIEALVIDDDSSLRAIIDHDVSKKKNGKGKLPAHIPRPRFLADPSHRTRVVARAIFALVSSRKGDNECKLADAYRYKQYFGYMLKDSWHLSLEEFEKRFHGVLEHIFNNHIYCDEKWCKPLRLQLKKAAEEENIPICGVVDSGDHPPSPISTESTRNEATTNKVSFYRCKTKHREVYLRMKKALLRFSTKQRMTESLHGFSTQMNECLNNMISYYAPKNKTYGMTMSLQNRIAVVTGVHNLGHQDFWTRAFTSMQIPISQHFDDNLTRRDTTKSNKRKYNEKKETKAKRMKVTYDKMQDLIKKQIIDEKRGATYQRGVAIEDSFYTEIVRIKKELQESKKFQCKEYGCHGLNHKTKSSKHCLHFTF